MSLEEHAKRGDRYKTLCSLRDKLAQMIDCCDNGHDVSALSNQLTKVLADIDQMEKQNGSKRKQSALDKARRAAKRG